MKVINIANPLKVVKLEITFWKGNFNLLSFSIFDENQFKIELKFQKEVNFLKEDIFKKMTSVLFDRPCKKDNDFEFC